MRQFVVATLVAAVPALAGCGSTVDFHGSADEQASVGQPPAGGTSAPADAPMPGKAWKASDGVPPSADPHARFPIDPNAVVLSLTSVEQSCGYVMPELDIGECAPEDEWQLLVAIPPALARPARIDLADPRLFFAWSDQRTDCTGGTGYGNSWEGTMEIHATDDVQVTGRVDFGDPFELFRGEFVATRCGTPPPAFVPSPAVAVRGSALDVNPSSGTGPAADPDTLYLYFDHAGATCADARPITDCTSNRQMVVGLPPALQVPGEISLADPSVDAMYIASEHSCSSASPDPGTLTISSISEAGMSVRVFGSGRAAMDGDYDVSICP